MKKFAAFLRGINVGGNNIIKMADLKQLFVDCGFGDVKTYIQSGNVGFTSNNQDESNIVKTLEKAIFEFMKVDIKVIIRTPERLKEIIEMNPYSEYPDRTEAKQYISLLSDNITNLPPLPYKSEKDGVEIIAISERDAFCLSYPLKNGNYGFPNQFLEKEYKVFATTRNLNTLGKLADY